MMIPFLFFFQTHDAYHPGGGGGTQKYISAGFSWGGLGLKSFVKDIGMPSLGFPGGEERKRNLNAKRKGCWGIVVESGGWWWWLEGRDGCRAARGKGVLLEERKGEN